ncbi:MAG: hypothetical protein JKX73_10670, partial [Flavobacteriales bacterium]|nr:hypothetical protein [Flavobacteriales bacterium]
ESHVRYVESNDNLFNEKKSKEIGRISGNYQMDKEVAEEERIEAERAKLKLAKLTRSNNLQYAVILLVIVGLAIIIFMLGKFQLPVAVVEALIFFTFLLLFEYTLVLLDPYIEDYSSGAPAIKLAFNALLAGLIFPLHSFFEEKLKSRIAN